MNKRLRGFQAPVARWLSVGGVTALSALAASGCGNEQTGTDINVDPPTAGRSSGGSDTQSGGSSSRAGNGASGSMSGESGAAEGGTSDIEAGGGMLGTGGGGMSGNAGKSSGGSAGMGGTAGISGGGNGGTAGAGGNAGSSGAAGTAGTSGAAGTAGTAGTAGNGGAAGTAGAAGTGGTAGTAGTAGAAGTGGTGGGQTCGNTMIEGTEECDDDPALGPSRLCSDDCRRVSTPECVECEQAGDCFASSDNCKGPAATPFSAENTGICYDVVRCVQDSNCLDGSGSLGKCYCGTLATGACGAAPYDLTAVGAPNGKCAAIMQKGFPGLTTNSAILGGLTTKSRPAGAAGQRLNCEKNDPVCAPICGVE